MKELADLTNKLISVSGTRTLAFARLQAQAPALHAIYEEVAVLVKAIPEPVWSTVVQTVRSAGKLGGASIAIGPKNVPYILEFLKLFRAI